MKPIAFALPILLPILLLAACGGGGDAAGNDTSEETTAAAPVEDIPANLQVDPGNTVVPLAPSPAQSPSADARLPQPLHGRWALGDADCDPARADGAKGLMVVAADRITLYESRGTPTRVTPGEPGKTIVELAFTGEGQQWTRTTTFTLLDGGRTLTAETPDDPEAPMRNLRYQRCPAPQGGGV